MDLKIMNAIRARRSIRDYGPAPVEEEKITAMLEAARLAPSSCNTQPWHFVIVKNSQKIKELAACVPLGKKAIGYYSSNAFAATAPVIMIACASPHIVTHSSAKIIGIDCLMLDMGIAVEHMVLAAAEMGLGTCWLGYFSEKRVKKLLKIPARVKVAALLTVGYPDEAKKPKEQKRKPLEQIYSTDIYEKV